MPTAGPFTVAVSGLLGTSTPESTGTHTLTTDGFVLNLHTDVEDLDGGLECGPLPDADVVVDTFEVKAATSTAPDPTPASSPVRPVLVQTDFAAEREAALPLLTAGGFAAVVLAAVTLGRSTRRARRRRY